MPESDRERISNRPALTQMLETLRYAEELEYRANRVRILLTHFVFGMLRGAGFAMGFSILSAIVIVSLRHVVLDNIPLIGGFLAEVVNEIQLHLQAH